jgi:hypothetical protein
LGCEIILQNQESFQSGQSFPTGIFDQLNALVMKFIPQLWFLAGCTVVGKTVLS